MQNTLGGTKKALLAAQEKDYEAKLDKLQCPQCKKYQSFSEYLERRRFCGACKERYVKLHVSKGKSWEAKQQENERRRQERLAKIEKAAYAACSFTPNTGTRYIYRKEYFSFCLIVFTDRDEPGGGTGRTVEDR